MTLRKKTLLMYAVTLVVLLITTYVIASTILLRGFTRLETQAAAQNVKRVDEAIADSLETLNSKAGDWSNWDDAYAFVEDHNPVFITKNLPDRTFIELHIDLMLFLAPDGSLAFAKAFDCNEQKEAPVPVDLMATIKSYPLVWQHGNIESNHTGLIMTGGGPMLVASRPILTSEGGGPIRGTLIMGKYLDDSEIGRLSKNTRLNLQVHSFSDLPETMVRSGLQQEILAEPSVVQYLDQNRMAAYTAVQDMNGAPALVVEIDLPRSVFHQGRTTMHYLFLALVGIGVVFCALTLTLLERSVFSRLWRLSAIVRNVERSGNLALRVTGPWGRDELSSLAESIDGMLRALDESQTHLRRANEALEQRVEERTAELAQANEALHRAHTELEHRVEERTAELSLANERLRLEVIERRRAEAALRMSEERYRELTDLLPMPVFETDAKGRLTFMNRAAVDMMGYSREDFEAGLVGFDLIHPVDRERARQITAQKMEGKKHLRNEYTALRKDGTSLPVEIYSNRVMVDGKPAGIRGILFDLTERKRMAAEVLKAQKLESLSVLAGGIAHDFNNILTAVIGNISLAKMYAKPGDEIYRRLADSEKASLRAKDLTHQLLTFSRSGTPVKNTISAAEILQESARFALRGSNVSCSFDLPEDLWPVDADEGQISQVINNLVINAIQAMPQGGTLRICGENIAVEGPSTAPLKAGRYVKLSIEDQGSGIPREVMDRIFDPYFTTKEMGSGLGLATAYSIIKRHNGYITAVSEPNAGTTFFVYLPASDGRPSDKSRRTPGKLANGKGRILVMDDEDLVRDIAGRMLSFIGYDVTLTRDGAEAIEEYRKALKEGTPFAAVLMDLTVPGGMGGSEAARHLREIDPNVRVIASSGYSSESIMSNYEEQGFGGFVAKPYKIDELSSALSRVLT